MKKRHILVALGFGCFVTLLGVWFLSGRDKQEHVRAAAVGHIASTPHATESPESSPARFSKDNTSPIDRVSGSESTAKLEEGEVDWLVGIVTDEHGEVAPGASVVVVEDSSLFHDIGFSGLRYASHAGFIPIHVDTPFERKQYCARQRYVSNNAGEFRISQELLRQRFHLVAYSVDGYADVIATTDEAPLRVVLREVPSHVLQVVDADSFGPVRGELEIESRLFRQYVPFAGGNPRIMLPKGRYSATIDAPHFHRWSGEIVVADDGLQPQRIEVRPISISDPIVIRGVVTTEHRDTLEDVRVFLSDKDSRVALRSSYYPETATFEIVADESLLSGGFLRAEADGCAPSLLVLEEDVFYYEIKMVRLSEIEVAVDCFDQAVQGAYVVFEQTVNHTTVRHWDLTDELGEVRFRASPEGEARIFVSHRTYGVDYGFFVISEAVHRVSLHLEVPEGQLRVRVLDEDGDPVADADVLLWSKKEGVPRETVNMASSYNYDLRRSGGPGEVFRTASDSEGLAEFGEVFLGPVAIQAFKDEAKNVVRTSDLHHFEIQAGSDVEGIIILPSVVTVEGGVVLDNNVPVIGIRIVLAVERESEWVELHSGETNKNGHFRFPAVRRDVPCRLAIGELDRSRKSWNAARANEESFPISTTFPPQRLRDVFLVSKTIDLRQPAGSIFVTIQMAQDLSEAFVRSSVPRE